MFKRIVDKVLVEKIPSKNYQAVNQAKKWTSWYKVNPNTTVMSTGEG
jgi:hypothetical protein